MDISNYLIDLQAKYNYSAELMQFLQKAIPALVTYYGNDKLNIILGALYHCEIHIQEKEEVAKDFLNQKFGTNEEWDIPFLAGAFQHTNLSLQDNKVHTKSIIYIPTQKHHEYKSFDFNDDTKASILIHEICHAIKGYGKLKVEDNKIVLQTGLAKDYYTYDSSSNTFHQVASKNNGIEEALNSYDEAEVMTILTGVEHKTGAYPGPTSAIRKLFCHPELAKVIKTSQFTGQDEWIHFLGKEEAESLSQNFEDWINVFYASAYNKEARVKADVAIQNLVTFVQNYSTPQEKRTFEEARKNADEKSIEIIRQLAIAYNVATNSFEFDEVPKM